MITLENLSSVLNILTEKEITKAMKSETDYLLLSLDGYGNALLTPVFDFEKVYEIIDSTGALFCDKEDFLELFKESESINPFLIELI